MLERFGMQDCKPCKTPAGVYFKKDCHSKYVSKPGKNHLIAAKSVLRYLQFSTDYHLEFCRGKATGNLFLYCYCHASWCCQEDGSSITGFVFKVLTGPVTWCAKKQSSIALSTAEAEYVALSHAVQEAIWLRHLLKGLGYLQLDAAPI
jgi:hypothetical protein